MNGDVSYYIDREDKMAAVKSPWLRILQDCTDYILPRRNSAMFYNMPSVGKNVSPQLKGEKVFDGTAIWANEQLAATLSSGVTSSTQRWFAIKMEDDRYGNERDEKLWLSASTEKLYNIYNAPRSFFNQQTHEMYLDLGGIGTGIQYLAEEYSDVPVRFQTYNLAEINFLENNRGVVDTVHRKFAFSTRQAVLQWGDKAPKKLLEIYNKGKDLDKQFDFLHCVSPREKFNPNSRFSVDKQFESAYIFLEGKEFVGEESGYDEMPYLITRWSKLTGELLGRAPGMICLPDIKMLNEMMKTYIKAAQKSLSPPLLVPDDGFLLPVTTVPDGITYYRSDSINKDNQIKYLEPRGRAQLSEELVKRVTSHILRCFYNDLSSLQEGPEMTATEYLQRTEERMRLMSPAIGRLHGEYCNPNVERVFNIAVRKGLLPPPPASLRGRPLKVEFVSPVVKAQKMTQAMMVQRMFDTLLPFSQLKPEIPDEFSGKGIAKWFMNIFDAPEEVRASDVEKKAIAQARADKENANGQASTAMAASEGLKNVAPFLKVMQGGGGGVG